MTALFNVPGAAAERPYHDVSVAPAGGRVVHVAGQVGGAPGADVSGGLAEQIERAMRNVALAIEAAGGEPEHLVKLTFHVVDWDVAKMPEFMAGMQAALAAHPFPKVPATLLGAHRLFEPHHLVEIEAVAVIPG